VTSTLAKRLAITLAIAVFPIIATAQQPNLVLILADDLGWADTTLYGKTSLYETPNIERLAARGMAFSNAYAANPLCSPTRASILSGQTPGRHGMTAPAAHIPEVRLKAEPQASGPPHQKCTNVKSATRIDPSMPTLGKVLKAAGYSTAHFGKWHIGKEPHSPLQHGFDVDIPHWHGPGPKTSYLAPWGYENPDFKEGEPGDHIEDRMAQEAVTWLKNRDKTKPFYMNYWQFSVHAPFGAKPELIERYRKKIKRGSPQQSPTYAAMVHSLDDAVGTLLDALEAEGVLDQTVIVFYSDNGGNIHCGLEETDANGEKYITAITSNHPLRGGKGGIHEGGIRVPAVVSWPGVAKPGSRSDVRIQSNDLYPTILRMLNVEKPKDHVIDGVDFAKALKGEAMDRGPIFTHVPGHGNTPQWLPPSTAVHHGDWKFIRTYHYGDDGQHQYRLYNLKDDIGESNNVAAAHPEKVKAMDKLIDQYIADANVAVPLPNPKFEPAKFDASQIGVQAGGLKMPKGKKPKGQPAATGAKPAAALVNTKAMLGWTAKNADVSAAKGSILVGGTGKAPPLFINSKLRVDGPAEAKLRVRAQKDGDARIQWRTEGQDLFPKNGQSQTFAITGGDWQDIDVPLPAKGKVVHVRLFLPRQKQLIEIDWIEVGSADGEPERWDFK
jgi:arylsulfatase A-like enzyme